MADVFDNSVGGKVDGGLVDDRLNAALKDLETWKTNAEKADDVKARLLLEKLEEDDVKMKAKQEMMACVAKQEEYKKEFNESLEAVQEKILELRKRRPDLLDKLARYQAQLAAEKAEHIKLKQKFKIHVQIPDTEVKFTGRIDKESEDDSQSIRGVFAISQRPTVILQGGQALITFEEEKVASQVLKIAKCSVSCDNNCLDVKPKTMTMDPSVKFEVHLDVSRKDLGISNVPPSMPEERMKDRLEMSFSRPSRGGGEVKSVQYNKNTRTGQITFLHPGVAEGLALRGKYCVDLDSEVNVKVGPIFQYQLCKFQTFCGSSTRTILLDDIKDMGDEEDMQDYLEIHFQKPSNCGGEIECIKYISTGKTLQAVFCEDMVVTGN